MNSAEADATYFLDAIKSLSDFGFYEPQQYLMKKGYTNQDGTLNSNAISMLSGVIAMPLLDAWDEDNEDADIDTLISSIANLEEKGQYAAVYLMIAALYSYLDLELPLDFIAIGSEDELLKSLVAEIRLDIEDWYSDIEEREE